MPKTPVINPRRARKSKSVSRSSDEVSANQVIDTLQALFDDLGVKVSPALSGDENIGKATAEPDTLYTYASAIGEMLTSWHQYPEYLDEKGNPARIKLGGKGPSFRRLAQLKVPKMDVSRLLSELERLGAVSIDEGKMISVHTRSFPVYEDKRLAARHTLKVLDGFIKTLRHNLDSSPSNSHQLFHRIAWNDRFDSRELPALKVRMKRYGQSFLESFDDWLMRKTLSKTRITKSRSKPAKVSIGVYLSVQSE